MFMTPPMGPKRMPSGKERLDLFHASVDTVEVCPGSSRYDCLSGEKRSDSLSPFKKNVAFDSLPNVRATFPSYSNIPSSYVTATCPCPTQFRTTWHPSFRVPPSGSEQFPLEGWLKEVVLCREPLWRVVLTTSKRKKGAGAAEARRGMARKSAGLMNIVGGFGVVGA